MDISVNVEAPRLCIGQELNLTWDRKLSVGDVL
jgi:hypothetical protein